MFTADLLGLEAWVDELAAAVDDGADAGLAAASRLVADEARAGHTFANRSGDLEASIRPLDVAGRARDGEVRGGVVADEEYASYVEERPGFAFLMPAWLAREADAALAVEAALERALRGA